jgi:N-acetylneuraminic acid mutarotase
MDRMAQHTKQPQVLREIFQSLGNDPLVVAECLARPLLAHRLLTELNNVDHVKTTTVAWQKEPMARQTANYTLPAISTPSVGCVDDTWTPSSLTDAPSPRELHTAVWTGSEMIVWGGFDGSSYFNTGGRYNPTTDSWTATSTTNAPTGRKNHTAVWTGSEMIVWSGYTFGSYLNDGGKYNPITDSWTATSTTNAPEARIIHTAVWTGSEMIVWGGYSGSIFLNTGGRYNPTTDSWTATNTTNAPASRWNHTAVWDDLDDVMIVWGGSDSSGYFNTGGRYNPGTDSWTATSTSSAPGARDQHRSVWDDVDRLMIVWAGFNGSSNLNTGGRYDPTADGWTATSTTNAPEARYGHTAVWTGSEMIVWGGFDGFSYFNTGGRYNPTTDSWTATSTTNAPTGRWNHIAVWDDLDNIMIVWGGAEAGNYFNTGGRYCAQSASPTPTPTATATATGTPAPNTRPTPTPRTRPTPTARPTPPPHLTPPPPPATTTPTVAPRPTPPPHLTPVPPPPSPRPTPVPRP